MATTLDALKQQKLEVQRRAQVAAEAERQRLEAEQRARRELAESEQALAALDKQIADAELAAALDRFKARLATVESTTAAAIPDTGVMDKLIALQAAYNTAVSAYDAAYWHARTSAQVYAQAVGSDLSPGGLIDRTENAAFSRFPAARHPLYSLIKWIALADDAVVRRQRAGIVYALTGAMMNHTRNPADIDAEAVNAWQR